MSTELQIRPQTIPAVSADELLQAWLTGLSPRTIEAYCADLKSFADWWEKPLRVALDDFLDQDARTANLVVRRFMQSLQERSLSPATIRRRLSSLKSIVRLARQIGLCSFSIEVRAPKSEAYRDTRGPDQDRWTKLLNAAAAQPIAIVRTRDTAILLLMHDMGLRRAEVSNLDYADCLLDRSAIRIVGKGSREFTLLSIPKRVKESLQEYIQIRGELPGALFRSRAGRLSGNGIWKILQRLSKLAGVDPIRPHGLRHAAITRALDKTNGDVRKVMRFSRHKKIETLLKYDDNRKDEASAIAELLSED